MQQLLIYSALFCLEYQVDPNTISIELRIYQLDELIILEPAKEDILYIMEKIVSFDKIVNNLKLEG
jgi:hypothetical protein